MDSPPIPTRIVEPVVSPEAAAPTPAVCPECEQAGNEALAASSRRTRKGAASPPQPQPDDNDPTPQGAD